MGMKDAMSMFDEHKEKVNISVTMEDKPDEGYAQLVVELNGSEGETLAMLLGAIDSAANKLSIEFEEVIAKLSVMMVQQRKARVIFDERNNDEDE